MKIFSKIHKKRQTIFKFLGITYCWKVQNKYYSKYKKAYFNNLIQIIRKFDIEQYKTSHSINICSFLRLLIKEENEYKSYYINEQLVKKISERELLKAKYFKKINKKHDQVYILNANSGEIYLFLKYILDALIKKDNAKNPILVATKKYHIDMIKMICPEIPYIFVGYVYANIKKDRFEIDGMRFRKIFSREHFVNVEEQLKKGDLNTHYFKSILKTLDLTEDDIVIRKVLGLEKSKKTMLRKIKKIRLNLDNFVLVSPEANSCENLPISFWEDLIRKEQEKGYDIFVNIKFKNVKLANINYKTCDISYSEAFELAKYAKKIYSLRSGFTEFLLDTKVPMEVYYTKFRNNFIESKYILSGFSLKQIPNVDKYLINEVLL